mgnify:CR=1 FL=1
MPLVRSRCPALNAKHHSRSAAKAAMAVSIKNALWKAIGVIAAVSPVTNKMLNILLPTMFPIAMPVFPLRAAVTDVTSSGSDVPKATIVRPIMRWLTPRSKAISVAS